jgi:microcystin-dependent protein
MSDPYVAEIRIFGFDFAPRGWAQCNGQLMPISQNTALFSLCGTFYGGDGKSTFGLPNLQGSSPMHRGDGPGLSQRFLGEQSGAQFVSLIQSEMPTHNHALNAHTVPADAAVPTGFVLARVIGATPYHDPVPSTVLMADALSTTGGSLPHNNMQPYLTLNFCIALQGVFPPRQ